MEKERILKRTLTEPEPEVDSRQSKTRRYLQQPSEPFSGVVGSPSEICEGEVIKFEVFISHRGPDTKENLAYHLYDLLRDRGVEVFLDREELQAGDDFPKAIQQAISCSRVQVCILSTGYAESVWCLKELEMMMDKYEIGASVLIPIFYDVTPADVRRLKGALGAGVQKQRQRFPSEIVDKWSNALCKIANITGYEGKGSLASTIVKKVCQVLDIGSVSTAEKIIGIEDQLNSLKHNIMRCRQEGLCVTSVEITGIGGIGKTTFAKALYNQIYQQYETCCFIEDVIGLVEKDGINAVHKHLISKLFRHDPSISKIEPKKHLKKKLLNADILVVLDNINGENCASAVFIEDDVALRATSTIIVTSREKGVLKHDRNFARHSKRLISLKLPKLALNKSIELFCHYAFEQIVCIDSQFSDLIHKIVCKCDGIPLALALFGKHVYGRDLAFWENFYNSIKDYLPPSLKEIIRFSYDHLDTHLEKCLFLDVAIFFRGSTVDLLSLFLDVAIFFRGSTVDLLRKIRGKEDEEDARISIALDNLQRKLLIKVKNGYLKMHDLLVDLGRTIVDDQSFCPGLRSRLWHPSDVRELLSEDRGTDKVEGLSLVWKGSAVMDEDENGDPCAWSADAFEGMPSLEFLILDGNCIEGDLSKLSKKLLWLKWTHFPFECLPRLLCLKRLRVLELSHGEGKLLWEHSPKEAPDKLRQLTLKTCTKLQRLPEFNRKFRQLSSIALDECSSLETIPDSFGLLQGLKNLEFVNCNALKLLPETIGNLQNILELRLVNCCELNALPMSVGRLVRLQSLFIDACKGLEQLPDTLGDLQNLGTVYISDCSKLKSLPMSFGHLPQIESLSISQCENLAIAEDSFGQITGLQRISLWGCKVQKLPCQVSKQNHLQYLSVYNTGGFYPANLPYLPSPLSTLVEVENLPHNMGNLRGLGMAELEQLACLTHLPESMENLSALTELHLIQCWNLQELPLSIGRLSGLTALTLDDCWSLQQLPTSIGDLSRLEELCLIGCRVLRELPESIARLSSLNVLHIEDCWSLQELPASIGNLSNLEDNLQIHGCSYLEVKISGCPNLQELPATIGNLHAVFRLLKIADCSALKGLPSTLAKLSKLEELQVKNCGMVDSIPIQQLLSLQYVEVSGCVNLKRMPHYASLEYLKDVTVHGCYQLLIPDSIVHQLHKLNSVSLSFNEELLRIHDINFEFENLPGRLYLNAKANPCLFPRLQERLQSLLDTNNYCALSFHQFCSSDSDTLTLANRGSFIEGRLSLCIVCYTGKNYTRNFTHKIPSSLKYSDFLLQFNKGISCNDWQTETQFQCRQFNFGEEIHFVVNSVRQMQCLPLFHSIRIVGDVNKKFPGYKAVPQEGWMICVRDDEGQQQTQMRILLVRELCKTFYSELQHQRLLSQAWSEVPSQLRLFSFSALDIANCKITKICLHCKTFLMEEETNFIWKRRRCLFKDDNALAWLQNESKFSYVAVPVFDIDLQTVANVFEICISILRRGNIVKSRNLQQQNALAKEEIPSRLYSRLSVRRNS